MSIISFNELIVIIVLCLLVLGPKQTFKLAFALGSLFSKAKSYLNAVKKELNLDQVSEINSTIKANNFKNALNYASPKAPYKTDPNKRQWTVSAEDFKTDNTDATRLTCLEQKVHQLEDELSKIKSQLLK